MVEKRRTRLYLILILALLGVVIDIWFVINNPQFRMLGLPSLIPIFDFLIILIIILIVRFVFPKEQRLGIYQYFGILSFSILLTINFALFKLAQTDILFYLYLSLFSLIVLLVSTIDNALKITRGTEDFSIPFHNSKKIPSKFVIPLWIACFLIFGLIVAVLGKALIGYPIGFATQGGIDNAILGSFGVGDWENIAFIVLPYTAVLWLLKRMKINIRLAIVLAFITSSSFFVGYHALVYSNDFYALLTVFFVSLFWITVYHFIESLVPLSGFHDGNNFFGIVLGKGFIGSAIVAVQSGFAIIPIIGIFSISVIIYILWKGDKIGIK